MSAKQLKHILGEYFRGTDFKEIDDTISIQKVWEKTVGSPINKNTEISSFKKGTIIVKVYNSIWRNELSLQKQNLLEKLNKVEPNFNIKKIILK